MARILTSITALLALSAANCLAQDAMLEDLYGRGVHAFFTGNIRGAFDTLNASIQSGSRDPRAFYYRGLVLNRLGRPDEAAADFRKGAELEMLGGEPYPVGKSLERIQGPERILLEAHRRNARLAIHNAQAAQERVRYEQVRQAETEVLRGGGRPMPAPPAMPARPDSNDPFAAPPPPPAPLPAPPSAPAPIPTPIVPRPTPDLFAPTAEAPPPRPLPAEVPPAPAPPRPAPVPAPAPADPFGDAPAAAAPTAPTPTAPRPTTPPASNDPFNDAPAAAPPAAAPTTPAPAPAAPKPAPSNDPFDDAPTTAPRAPAPAPTTPPAPEPSPPAPNPPTT